MKLISLCLAAAAAFASLPAFAQLVPGLPTPEIALCAKALATTGMEVVDSSGQVFDAPSDCAVLAPNPGPRPAPTR